MDFKERIFQARKAKGFSQEDLAEAVGVSRQAVSKWETGEAMPDMEKLIALCQALELSMEYLALGKGAPSSPQEPKKPRRWIIGLLAAVCFAAGLLIGYFLPSPNTPEAGLSDPTVIAEAGPLDPVEISDVTVTYAQEGISPDKKFDIAIYPSRMPEGMAAALLWGPPGEEPHTVLCTREEDHFKVTLYGYHDFQYRISVLLTLDGQEKQVRILDVYGSVTDFSYERIS